LHPGQDIGGSYQHRMQKELATGRHEKGKHAVCRKEGQAAMK